MPGQGYTVATSSSIALSINTPTTIVTVFGSSGPSATITEVSCTWDGNMASTGNPVLWQLIALDGATTGTFTARTPNQLYGWAGSTGQITPSSTGRTAYTAEPGNIIVLKQWNIPGTIQSPLGREPVTQATTGLLGKGYGIRASVASSSQVPYAYIQFEE